LACSRRSVLHLGLGCALTSGHVYALDLGTTDWPEVGDQLVAVDHPTHSLGAEDIIVGAPPILTWPRNPATGKPRTSLFSQILLLRLATPGAKSGEGEIIAYSAVCKHAGCIVSSWIADQHILLCPCHGSEYDPAHRGAVVAGPAALPLPSIPIKIVARDIVIAGPFSARPGGVTGRTD
jgi:rieske iron-sulfur protein